MAIIHADSTYTTIFVKIFCGTESSSVVNKYTILTSLFPKLDCVLVPTYSYNKEHQNTILGRASEADSRSSLASSTIQKSLSESIFETLVIGRTLFNGISVIWVIVWRFIKSASYGNRIISRGHSEEGTSRTFEEYSI